MKRKVFVGLFFVLLFGFLSAQLTAQNFVTPIVAPTPAGELITVNHTGGDHYDPHVSGDLVAYSNDNNGQSVVHYFNLANSVDSAVPNDGTTMDFLSDIRGSIIAFTRVDTSHSAIFEFDTSTPNTPPVELAPQPSSARQAAQIGDQTIAWQDYGFYSDGASDIVAYAIPSQVPTRLTSDDLLNQTPGVSPDGKVVAWAKCKTFAYCDIWSATGGGTTWIVQQLTNGSSGGGLCSHPDSDGQVVAYSCNRSGKDSIYWQAVAGGTEQVLSLPGSAITPSVSGGLIAFAYELPNTTNHNLYVFDTSTSNLYEITNGTDDVQLNDISVTSDGNVRVVWQIEQVAVYAYTFKLPDTTPPSLTLPPPITAPATGPQGAIVTYNATATDNVDGTDPVICSPSSGSTFPLGMTTVTCTATDKAGNTASGTFTVTVVDATPPVISSHPSIVVVATSAAGAIVTYTNPTATDNVDGTDPVSCTPASGSAFPPGTTAVICTAIDKAGNTASSSFAVTVTDFSLGAITPIVVSVGASASTPVPVNALYGFSSPVGLSATGAPAGVAPSLSPVSLTPPGSSSLSVTLSPAVTPSRFTLTVTGASGTLTHSTTASVTVNAGTSNITNVIAQLLSAACIDNSGIGNALTSKLSAAQAYINAGDLQDAINTLKAFISQLQAQSGKHIATSCTIGGVTFNPANVLITDAQSLINSLSLSTIPDPITGYVVNSSGVGLSGATVSILSGTSTVAMASTDITGFYYFATTGGVLTLNANYTVAVTGLPSGFTSAPAAQTFTWNGSGIVLNNFVLN